mmetsp:Transcript_4387/g.10568  ORF Transcript_4387/g.10568 Transcript_4387/m.10568 type:complete len:241 (-) Transcript_4387:1259-1981(-)
MEVNENHAMTGKKIQEFKFSLKVYPISFIGKNEWEKGDKIILPPSILEILSNVDTDWPLMFTLDNGNSFRKTHCGVMEFTADEGCSYIPYWMMQNLIISIGEKITFKYVHLEKGSYVKIQPQTEDFLKISNPKAVLEAKLRNFTCLTKDTSIAIEYNSKIFWINIVEVKPGNAISIIETDINVDFISPSISRKEKVLEKQISEKTIEKNISKENGEESSTNDSEIEKLKKKFQGSGYSFK